MTTDYVNKAHERIKSLMKNPKDNKIQVTTSQIRKILSAANSINNKLLALEANGKIKNDTLPEEIINDCLALKVLIVYQSAREKDSKKNYVKDFVEKTKLIEELDSVGNSATKLKQYFRYIEALVAYHKFEGGRD
jgi:CRISPR-associated protein Csm2